MLKRLAVLCLCLALLTGTACGEIVEITQGADIDLYYDACPLPDGRVLLAGLTVTGRDARAMLVCLDTDRTVRWEYIDPEAGACNNFFTVARLPDGTIAAVRFIETEEGAHKYKAVFFTPDGKPTGKETDLSEEGIQIRGTGPSWILQSKMTSLYDYTYETTLKDWDGNVLARYEGDVLYGGYGSVVWNDGEPAAYGTDAFDHGRAKFVKMDGTGDRVRWETTMDSQWPEMKTENASIERAVQTGDSGYAAVLREETADGQFREALVKLDAEGSVRWVNREALGENGDVRVLCEYDGKIVASVAAGDDSMGTPRKFLWFDGDGKELGSTELALDPADFRLVGKYYNPADKKQRPTAGIQDLFPMADGLWAFARCEIWSEDKEGYSIKPYEFNEYVLIRIPEL